MTEKKRECEDCFEYQPLGCGAHGDCNETGLIAPYNANCPSWHRDHVEQLYSDEPEDDFEGMYL